MWFIFSPLSPSCPTPGSFSFSFSFSSSRTLFFPSLPWSFFDSRLETAEPLSMDFDVFSKPPHFCVTCFCCLAIYKTHTGSASLSLSLAYLCPGRQVDGGEAGGPPSGVAPRSAPSQLARALSAPSTPVLRARHPGLVETKFFPALWTWQMVYWLPHFLLQQRSALTETML